MSLINLICKIMTDPAMAQQVSLAILGDRLHARQQKLLDQMELEDSSLSQLHPLAQIIALHERGRIKRISRKMLQNATKTIAISGICEMCDEDVGDDWDLTYYQIHKEGRGLMLHSCIAEPIYNKEIILGFQLAYEMSGGSMDGFSAVQKKISLSMNDLPLASEMLKAFSEDQKWLEHLLSVKSKINSSLDPGHDNLDGYVAIYLEAVSIRLDGRVLTNLVLPNTRVMDLRYSVGALDDTCSYFPIDDASKEDDKCFWPNWLPSVADELALQMKGYYQSRLSSETDECIIERTHHALSSLDTWSEDSLCPGFFLEVEDLADLGNCSDAKFWDVTFSLSQKMRLPQGFNAPEDIGTNGPKRILLKLIEISKNISAPER